LLSGIFALGIQHLALLQPASLIAEPFTIGGMSLICASEGGQYCSPKCSVFYCNRVSWLTFKYIKNAICPSSCIYSEKRRELSPGNTANFGDFLGLTHSAIDPGAGPDGWAGLAEGCALFHEGNGVLSKWAEVIPYCM
jgi:hypothetical protein